MPLTSDINSSSFHLGMEVLRAQVAATGRGEFTMGGETVRIEYSPTDGRFLASDGTGGLFTELLLLGFNNGPQWICPYISRHLLSLNPLQARCRRYSRGER
ncbi:hypothetical protein ABMP38_005192 [Escherichia coli]|nr:T3SS effector NleG [Escherichia coli]